MAIAIIGGTGFTAIKDIALIRQHTIETPYGKPSSDIMELSWHNQSVFFLARHGNPHTIAPHQVNYRANIWALQQCQVDTILAVNAVGSMIHAPGSLVIPHQLIDYTFGREQSFFIQDDTGQDLALQHIDFTHPYTEAVRQKLLLAGKKTHIALMDKGVYAVTQGPRLETMAEVDRLAQDGCDIIGMTAMPEAALARELQINYACCAIVVNWAAGRGDSQQEISHLGMLKVLQSSIKKIQQLFSVLIKENK